MEIFGTAVVYTGLLAAFLGFISVLRPLRFLGIATRPHGLILFGCGLFLVLIGFCLPARETRIGAPQTQLDSFVPAWQFQEFHSIRVNAPPERVYRALKEVRAKEIRFFVTLTWIRRFGRPGPESILNVPEEMPLLEVATRTSFLVLAEEPHHEMVLGTLAAAPRGWRSTGKPSPEGFRSLRAPGFALAAMDFRLEDAGSNGTILTTETRVYATDASTRRRFAPYWRTIYPGSALIRRMWLRAIKRRAEDSAAR
jgi:hypothetical protein